MKKVFTMGAIAIVLLSCSTKPKPVNHKDSTEYAVYDGTPIDYPEDLEPVYIPMELNGAYRPGDTILADSNGKVVTLMLRDAETHRYDTLPGWHKVCLGDSIGSKLLPLSSD